MPKNILSALSNRLRKARNDHDFTQEWLSEMSGVSARHIANIEKYEVNPSFEILRTRIKTLSVSFDSLFDPSYEQLEAEIQEITGLYRSCPKQEAASDIGFETRYGSKLLDTNTGQKSVK